MKSLVLVMICFCYTVSLALCCCPNGWIHYDGSCYLIETQHLNWHDAQIHCGNLDGHVVKPETAKENNFLRQTLKRYFQNITGGIAFFWIDGNDIAIENDWVWGHNGGKINFFDWGPHEPNGGRKGNCMNYYRSIDFAWSDDDCLATGNFICEMENSDNAVIVGR